MKKKRKRIKIDEADKTILRNQNRRLHEKRSGRLSHVGKGKTVLKDLRLSVSICGDSSFEFWSLGKFGSG